MHLKTLTLRGFKSFAGATTLRLEPGITCVVGPNGSGKSNVVDALAWVMGEQGAKTLRGGQMADVIFAGTSGRAPLGRAQVDLTIDNSDGVLDIDYSEVTISRTLFRGGGSEYRINGAPARLLDVQELLSDTGMGRQMHVIVGQGQLDAILSSTPEERRGFIEEAAGVLKHRRRKERALRKLADMDANLVRVLDLTEEIRRQLGPLARQAKTARRASLIQARVRDARARLLADDLVTTGEQLASQTADDRALAERRAALEERIAAARADLARIEAAEAAASPRADEAMRAWQELTTLHERLKGTRMAAEERIALRSRPEPESEGEDPEELDRRAQESSDEDVRLAEEVEAARTALAEQTRARERLEEADAAANADLARVNRDIADRREQIARLTGDVSSAVSRHEAAVAEAERAGGAAAEARARAASAQAQADATAAPDDEGADEGSAAAAHAAATAARDAARARVDELLGAERAARADRSHWEARRDTLAQSLAPEDATADLLGGPGAIDQVAALLRAQTGFEDAIAALIAPFSDAVAVESDAAARANLAHARKRGSGMIRMVVASPSDRPGTGSDGARRRGLPGAAVWARDAVELDPRLDAALADLLDGAVVVDDLDGAAGLADRDDVTAIVTRRGDVLRRGRITGSGVEAASILTLRARYDEARDGADGAADRQRAVEADLEEASAALDAAIRAANEALRALRDEDAQRARAAQESARAHSAAAAAQGEAERAEAIAARAAEQVEWTRAQVDDARARLDAADGLDAGEDLDAAETAARRASAAARAAREEETSMRLALRALEEQSRQVQGRARSLRQAAAREREERRQRARREARRRAELAVAEEVAAGAGLALDAASRALADAEAERRSAQEERARASTAIADARRSIDAMNVELAELTSASHRDEIARAQTQMRLDQLRQRSLDDLSMEADALVEEYGPHLLVPVLPNDPDADPDEAPDPVAYVRAEQERALEAAMRDLERLGRVNPLALEEHAALAKRHEFLVSQVGDLKKSKADLLRIVEDVDRLVEEAFASAFRDTREQFAHTFEVLFPGGQGDLVLTDPDSMLTTGIEIEARPAGKKVKRLSLLSGGERSLAAIAFLVAIFKARPSPFYVMDEVEAALDDINLGRLLAIFQELQEESQLIVITHQKRTMEIADALYGVTMRAGVTTVVSQRLDA
ncbi:chromosome segregation protein SMC [Actinomyces sp. B33]|uniref:chromosome segregation protein SMC n=1 Tax=Actinomyces sp. B33 TaxID=2942131 RepID=UPI0023403683|nr:chromosome segregation protein SMC [Actinomyces sp. B33]MDC4233177.1 chromosome segregation protein SMC [Actinomyces sp. B33]